MRVAFLLGAGASIPAGMPSTAEITARVLSGEGIARHTNSNYYEMRPLNAHMGKQDEYVPKVLVFLKVLKAIADKFYSCGEFRSEQTPVSIRLFGRHETNYEDLYYLAEQLHNSGNNEFENPALQPLVDTLRANREVNEVCVSGRRKDPSDLTYGDLQLEACIYITCVVWSMLAKMPRDTSVLSLLGETTRDPGVTSLDVYTLNHDTVFEKFCQERNVAFTDGFSDTRGEVRYWNPTTIDNPPDKVRLFKLHGSVNWFRFAPHLSRWQSECVGIPVINDIWHTHNEVGEMQRPDDFRPELLIGTFNKMLHYGSGIFADLHFRFYSNIRETDFLVVSGYGFADKGINGRLIDWVGSSDHRRLVVVDPGLYYLRNTARGAIRRAWLPLARQGRLKLINKGFQKVTWAEVKGLLLKDK